MEINKLEAHFTMTDWYRKVLLENYGNFSGRARRAEYWNFVLMNILIMLGLYGIIILGAVAEAAVLVIIGFALVILYSLFTLIPSLAVAVRRLHDTNKSGAYLLLGFIPLAGFVLLAFYIVEGDAHDNSYGPDPKNYMALA